MNITKTILHLIPDAQFYCRGNDYNTIVWHENNSQPLPTLEELTNVEADAIKAAEDKEASDKAIEELKATDWYVIRSLETGAQIPADIISKRAQLRTKVIK